jgi:hypothetical protein
MRTCKGKKTTYCFYKQPVKPHIGCLWTRSWFTDELHAALAIRRIFRSTDARPAAARTQTQKLLSDLIASFQLPCLREYITRPNELSFYARTARAG